MPNGAESPTRHLSGAETAALIASLFFVGVSFGGSTPLVASLLESRGASEYFTGAVLAMLSVGLAVFSPVAGRLVDRFGARLVNVTGLLAQAVGFVAIGVSLETDARYLLGARLWLGIAAALTFVAAEFALLKGTRPSIRGRVMSLYSAAFGGGFMLGVFSSGHVYDAFGLVTFYFLGTVGVAIAPLAFWSTRGVGVVEVRRTGPPERLGWVAIAIALYGAVVYAVLDIAMTGTYPIEGQRLGLEPKEALEVVGFMAFGTVAVQPLAGYLADRWSNKAVYFSLCLLGAVASVSAGYASRFLPGQLTATTASYVLMGAAAGGVFPVSLALLGERTTRATLSRANAAFSTVFGYASLAAPLAAAAFIDAVERFDLLGWAVPSLSLLTFGTGALLAWWDRRR